MSLSRLELLTFRLSNEHSTIELQALGANKIAVGVEGFEPSVMVPKTTALPLGYTPESVIARAGEEGIEPPPLSLKPRILAVELFPRFIERTETRTRN